MEGEKLFIWKLGLQEKKAAHSKEKGWLEGGAGADVKGGTVGQADSETSWYK